MKTNNKKKGFTLIELIAVIAILGILAAVLVPNIIGYINKAKVSKAVADAKTIVSAVDYYNADNAAAQLLETETVTNLKTDIVGANSAIKDIASFPKEFQEDTKISDLRALASGVLTYDGSLAVTIGKPSVIGGTKYNIVTLDSLKDMVIFK